MNEEMLTISRPQLEWLQAVARAARRFDETGSVARQMNPKQWQAYIELKALFHSGIEREADKSSTRMGVNNNCLANLQNQL